MIHMGIAISLELDIETWLAVVLIVSVVYLFPSVQSWCIFEEVSDEFAMFYKIKKISVTRRSGKKLACEGMSKVVYSDVQAERWT